MKIDVHAHLAGVGSGASGCWMSPEFRQRPVLRFLRWWYDVTDDGPEGSLDQDWAAALAALIAASELDSAVALGFDGVYGADGVLDRSRSQMVVPVGWVLAACRRHPEELLPGPSINPARRDADERLDEAIEGGAVLVKWLPSAQGIDPGDPANRPFYRRLADAGVPLLVHSGGGELTFAEIAPHLKDVRLLERPLEEGVTVICAHSGVPVHMSRDPNQLGILREMLERYPTLWLDNSGMANPSRFAHLARLARDPLFVERTLYGSDYPVPSLPVYYPRRLGLRTMARLQRERNPFDRDIGIKRGLGYPDSTLTLAARLLPRASSGGTR